MYFYFQKEKKTFFLLFCEICVTFYAKFSSFRFLKSIATEFFSKEFNVGEKLHLSEIKKENKTKRKYVKLLNEKSARKIDKNKNISNQKNIIFKKL